MVISQVNVVGPKRVSEPKRTETSHHQLRSSRARWGARRSGPAVADAATSTPPCCVIAERSALWKTSSKASPASVPTRAQGGSLCSPRTWATLRRQCFGSPRSHQPDRVPGRAVPSNPPPGRELSFRVVARRFILSEPPSGRIPLSYGDNFPRFLRSQGNAASIKDVATLPSSRWSEGGLSAPPPERLEETEGESRIMTPINTAPRRPRVVIIGAGFGGLSAAKQLAQAPFDVIIVDRHNDHLFQPLLHQVAPLLACRPGDIALPICGVLRRQNNQRNSDEGPGRLKSGNPRSGKIDRKKLPCGCQFFAATNAPERSNDSRCRRREP